jgi:peptidyl-prolyl cis-trans isomerase B (cyclophilin B)
VATTKQRRRQLAREKAERQQQQRRARAARQRRLAVAIGLAILLVVALVLVVGAWLGSDDGDPAAAEGECLYTATEPVEGIGPPPGNPVTADSATLMIDGEPVTIALLADEAPCTVGSLVHLAAQGYFDGTTCHRLTTSDTLRVLQCGDPTGTGSGGPGYEFGLENVAGASYDAGTVAMARRGGDPNSNGSQFFLVYDDSQLPPEYTVFGRITDGLDVITRIADQGTADGSDDGEPAEPVTIDALVAGT